VLDWRKRQQSRAAVMLSIEYTLEGLPESYSKDTYKQKCDLVYQHVFESYYGEGRSIYSAAS
jgi:type I restriction enzyme R subunit